MDAWLILFRKRDTWVPGHVLYYDENEVQKAADCYSSDGETVLIVKVQAYKGHSKCGVRSTVI